MADTDERVTNQHAGGLISSVQRLINSVLAVVQTRIEIIATEFEEERERIKELVFYGVFALVFISLGIIALTVFVTIWLWETYGIQALGILGLVFLGIGFTMALLTRKRERARPRLFATTLAEISKDRDTLRNDHE